MTIRRHFPVYCKREYWKCFQSMINVEGKKGNDRNKCRLSCRHSKAGCYHQIINSPQWCWGHFNKPIQGGLLLLGIMICGSTVFHMNNRVYILQQQSLLELFYVCWYIWHFSLIIAKWIVWYLYFHHYKKSKTNQWNYQTSANYYYRKDGQASKVRKHLECGRICKVRIFKKLIFIPLTCLCLLRIIANNFSTKSFLLSYKAWHMKMSLSLQALCRHTLNLLPEVYCKVTWGLGLS